MLLGLKRTDLQALAQAKLDDGTLLFQHKRYSNAYYLAGYAIEMALKACIAAQFTANTIPDKGFVNSIYSHHLPTLVNLAGLKTELEEQSDADVAFAANWALVAQWTEAARYKTADSITTEAFFDAITDSKSGVFQWIKKFW